MLGFHYRTCINLELKICLCGQWKDSPRYERRSSLAGASSLQVTGPQLQITAGKFNISCRERGEEAARSRMLRKAALGSLLTVTTEPRPGTQSLMKKRQEACWDSWLVREGQWTLPKKKV